MSKITILKETAPTRCEVCHQADYYDAITNSCSRCGNINSLINSNQNIDYQLATTAQGNYQLIKPDAVELIDSGSNYLITYHWHSSRNRNRTLYFFLILLSGLFNGTNLLHRTSTFSILFFAFIIFLYLLIFIRAFINKTNITISATKLLLNNSPISLFDNKEIELADIREVFYHRRYNNDMLYVRLKSGKKIKLIQNIEDKDSLLFIEKILKEKIKHLN